MNPSTTMLGDGKIDSLDTHLEQFKLNNRSNQTELQTILKEYSQLLDDYKRLRKAYEDRDVNAANKSIDDNHRKPYVLVLIDGNGYIFNDDLIQAKEEGGATAAQRLNDVIRKYLQETMPRLANSTVLVRMYADVTALSKLLAKSKLGLEKRSLAAFTAGFTRALNFSDFIDALDEEGTRFKIREMFSIGVEDCACEHILYAACHDLSYLPQLVPYSGIRNKITLVQGAGFNSEFLQFSLNVTQFPSVFRWSDLPVGPLSGQPGSSIDRTPTPAKSASRAGEHPINSLVPRDKYIKGSADPRSIANDGGERVHQEKHDSTKSALCKYFQKGYCRYGNKCSFKHALPPREIAGLPLDCQDRLSVSKSLPRAAIPGFIPLNKDQQRLDMCIRPPTTEEWAIYNARFRKQKPCNDFHLQRVCTNIKCPFDHTDLETEALHTLEYVLRCNPCPRKSECRKSGCIYGHLCQKDGCVGQMKGCRMRADLHAVDPKLASMVPTMEGNSVQDNFEGSDTTGGGWY